MKFLILFLFLSLTSVSQTSESQLAECLNTLMRSRIKWKSISRNTFTPLEKQSITYIIKDTGSFFCNDPQIDGDYYEDFHLIDLDGDKDLDIIYEGNECVNDYSTIIIYINNGMYKKVLYTHGIIVDLNSFSDLTIYQPPCCVSIENTFIHYIIKKDSLTENFGLGFFYSIALKPVSKDYNLIIPNTLKAGNRYMLKANSGINYVPKDSLDQPVFLKKSLAGSVSADVNVTAYSSVKDKQGIEWLYCRVSKEAVVLSNGKPVDYPVMVWIKQKNCIKL